MGVMKMFKKEYQAWIDMRRRCKDTRRPNYHLYGGRGVSVCDRWDNSFADFISDVGVSPDPSFVLDRINNDGNYDPGNVKWSSPQDSTNNRRRTRHVIVNGEKMAVERAAEVLGCTGANLRFRLSMGQSEEEAGRKPTKKPTLYEVNGERKYPTQWAKHYGLPPATVNTRLRRGETIGQALGLEERPMRHGTQQRGNRK